MKRFQVWQIINGKEEDIFYGISKKIKQNLLDIIGFREGFNHIFGCSLLSSRSLVSMFCDLVDRVGRVICFGLANIYLILVGFN